MLFYEAIWAIRERPATGLSLSEWNILVKDKGGEPMANCNEKNCNCTNTACERHGKCCLCINFHREKGSKVFCMRDKK